MLVPIMRRRTGGRAIPQILQVRSRHLSQLGAFILSVQLRELGLETVVLQRRLRLFGVLGAMLGAEPEPGDVLPAHVAHLDESGFQAVEEGLEVDHAGGENAETLDDLRANRHGPDIEGYIA